MYLNCLTKINNTMKKLVSIIKRQFRVEYRLTIIVNGKTMNTYGTNRRLLSRMARNTPMMEYWSLYKKGPFGLPEREVDFGMRGDETRGGVA